MIASAIATTLFAAPAFADCAADFAKVQDAMKAVKMDDKTTAAAKDITAKITGAITKKDEVACAASLADLAKLAVAK